MGEGELQRFESQIPSLGFYENFSSDSVMLIQRTLMHYYLPFSMTDLPLICFNVEWKKKIQDVDNFNTGAGEGTPGSGSNVCLVCILFRITDVRCSFC